MNRSLWLFLCSEISTIKRMDVIIPVKRVERRAELTVRTVARPERRVAETRTRMDLVMTARKRIPGAAPARATAQAAA